MTFPGAIDPSVAGAARSLEVDRSAGAREAAQRFEGLFLEQLVSVMRQSASMFEGTGGEMYAQMFDQNMGDALARSGGVGLADVLARAMGADPAPTHLPIAPLGPSSFTHSVAPSLASVLMDRPASGTPLDGATGALQQAADAMLPDSGVALQWSREGTLTTADLASTFSTGEPGSEAAFAVRDARGFAGYYKCNLFAMELARRAGFEVPVASRPRGYGYPGPDAVTADAADGELRASWGQVVTGARAEQIDSAIVEGRGAFLLTSAGHDGHHGHMGIVERVHSIDYDAEGRVARIVFDGWEARSSGAMHLTQRTWSTYGHGSVEGGRSGLDRIEIIQLRRPEAGQREEQPLHGSAPASVLDRPAAPSSTSER